MRNLATNTIEKTVHLVTIMFAATSHFLNQRIYADKLFNKFCTLVIGYKVPYDTHVFMHARFFDSALARSTQKDKGVSYASPPPIVITPPTSVFLKRSVSGAEGSCQSQLNVSYGTSCSITLGSNLINSLSRYDLFLACII